MLRARVSVNADDVVAPVNRRLFGSFVEHLGRCVYDGLYEPGHPTADADGFRLDVVDLVRSSGSPRSATPAATSSPATGGRTGSAPASERPRRLDLAWHSTETNEVGLDEFCAGSPGRQRADARREPRAPAASSRRSTCSSTPTPRSARRSPNGERRTARPSRTTSGCGAWATRWTARGSSATVRRRLRQARRADRAGDAAVSTRTSSSSRAARPARDMPTFGTWERTVLEHTYDDVDYISCHAYYEEHDGDLASFLASSVDMDHFIRTVVATADHVKARCTAEQTDQHLLRRVERLVPDPRIAPTTGHRTDDWPVAPRLLEDIYTVADAVVVGSLLISLLKHADRVTLRQPRAARQRDRADHDRARRHRLAADHVLPVRDHVTARTQAGAAPRIDSPRTTTCRQGKLASGRRRSHVRPRGRGGRVLPRQPKPDGTGRGGGHQYAARLADRVGTAPRGRRLREEHDGGAAPSHPEDPESRR